MGKPLRAQCPSKPQSKGGEAPGGHRQVCDPAQLTREQHLVIMTDLVGKGDWSREAMHLECPAWLCCSEMLGDRSVEAKSR